MSLSALSEDDDLRLLLEAIYRKYHYDFRGYSLASLKRRLLGMLASVGSTSIAEVTRRLLSDDGVFPRLLQALTVQVSDMFRDPSYFRFLREHVVPTLGT